MLPYLTMSNCKNICRLCDRLIISRSVAVVTVGGVDTLVIDLPQRAYNNCEKYCIIVIMRVSGHLTASVGGNSVDVFDCTNEKVDVYWLAGRA